MFAIWDSPNAFWVYERLIFSLLTGLTLLAYFYAYKKITAHQEKLLKDTERWYLVLSTFHLIFQFIYNFVIESTFFLYFAQVILYIELLCINDTFTFHLEGLSENIKGWIETVTVYGTVGVLVFGVVLVLEIESDNQCGQNLFILNLVVYTLLSIFTTAELLYIVRKKNQKLNKLAEQRSYDMDNELVQEFHIKQEGLKSTRQFKLFFVKLSYIVIIGYLINASLFIYKLSPVVFGNVRCNNLFENRQSLFSVIFSVFEFFGFNLLNLFIYYEYFWVKRQEFNPPDEKLILNEVYDNNRSSYIRDLVEDDGFANDK